MDEMKVITIYCLCDDLLIELEEFARHVTIGKMSGAR